MESIQGPVVILWDIENCPVPSDVRPEDVASNICLAVRAHSSITGAITSFSAYGDFNCFPRRLREGFQRTGVKLVDVPNGRKDAADKAIMVDMFLFALDHRPPSTIILISGDVDFAPALHIFGQRGYTIILAIPATVAVSSALCSAGRFVWDWPCIARGTGLVLPKNLASQGITPISLSVLPVLEPVEVWIPGQSSHFSKSSFDDRIDVQNEEATIVYGGNNSRMNQVPINELSSQSTQNISEGHYDTCSTQPQSLQVGMMEGACEDPISSDQDKWWVKPGDTDRLKEQMVILLEKSGGTLPLAKVSPEYLKHYGRHLYLAEYGAAKLVHLFSKMNDAFIVIGQGPEKALCLKNNCNAENLKKCATTPIILKHEHKVSCISAPSPFDKEVDDKAGSSPGFGAGYEYNDGIERFKLDVRQELPREHFGQPAHNISEEHYDDCSTQPQSSQVGMMEGACEDPVSMYKDKWLVKPADIDRLKEQMVMLFQKSGGTLPLVKVPPQYLKLYGRRLCLAEYGATKLAHLFSRMNDAFVLIGQGPDKTLCLRNNCDAENLKKCASTPIILKQEHKVICISTPLPEGKPGCSADEKVDDEAGSSPGFHVGDEYNKGIEGFKLEVHQELPRELFGQPAQNISEGHCDDHSTHPQSSQVGMMKGAIEDLVSMDQDERWVKSGDIYRAKEQMVMLLEKSGGTLPLAKVSTEYQKLYGRPLHLAEYGAAKLVHLLGKMNDAFIVIGQGPEKTLCFRNNYDAENLKKCASLPIILEQEHKVSCISTPFFPEEKSGCSSGKEVDDEVGFAPVMYAGDEYNEGIARFKLEVCQKVPTELFGQPGYNISEGKYDNCSTQVQCAHVGKGRVVTHDFEPNLSSKQCLNHPFALIFVLIFMIASIFTLLN